MATNPETFRVATPSDLSRNPSSNSPEQLNSNEPKKPNKIARAAAALALLGGGVFVGAKVFGGSESSGGQAVNTTETVQPNDSLQPTSPEETIAEPVSSPEKAKLLTETTLLTPDLSPQEIYKATYHNLALVINEDCEECAELFISDSLSPEVAQNIEEVTNNIQGMREVDLYEGAHLDFSLNQYIDSKFTNDNELVITGFYDNKFIVPNDSEAYVEDMETSSREEITYKLDTVVDPVTQERVSVYTVVNMQNK